MKKRINYLGLVLSLGLLLTACGSQPKKESTATTDKSQTKQETKGVATEYPLTVSVTDADGQTHKEVFKEAPKRIVTNNLSTTEILLKLGLKEQIVGMMKPDNKVTGTYAKQIAEIPVIGDKMTVSKEKIAGANPDIVVGRAMTFTNNAMGSVQELNDLGIQTYIQKASNMKNQPKLATVLQDVRMLGKIFNKNAEAEKYADQLARQEQAVLKKVAAHKGKTAWTVMPIVAYDGQKSSFSVFAISGGVQADLLKQLNLKAALKGRTANPSLETIVQANPDVILYVTADRNRALDQNAVANIEQEALLKDVSAVKKKRIYTVSYDDFMDYGPRLFTTLEKLSQQLYTTK